MTGAATLTDALATAHAYWGNDKSSRVQQARARVCVEHLGGSREVASLSVSDAVKLLTWLRDEDYSPESIHAYYATFKRIIALSGQGGLTVAWPSPPPKPRKSKREPIREDDLQSLISWFRSKGYGATADLACVLWGTGLRIDREALTEVALKFTQDVEGPYDTLEVTGKGGHERVIPVVDPCARQVLGDEARMREVRRTPYVTHLDRWKKGVKACGIMTKMPTPHAVRHAYASEVLRKSGGQLAMAQQLLGHADPATTARYLAVALEDKAQYV